MSFTDSICLEYSFMMLDISDLAREEGLQYIGNDSNPQAVLWRKLIRWSHQNLFLRPFKKVEIKCFLTQAGPLPYPSVFSFSLGMNGLHQPPGQVRETKTLSYISRD